MQSVIQTFPRQKHTSNEKVLYCSAPPPLHFTVNGETELYVATDWISESAKAQGELDVWALRFVCQDTTTTTTATTTKTMRTTGTAAYCCVQKLSLQPCSRTRAPA